MHNDFWFVLLCLCTHLIAHFHGIVFMISIQSINFVISPVYSIIYLQPLSYPWDEVIVRKFVLIDEVQNLVVFIMYAWLQVSAELCVWILLLNFINVELAITVYLAISMQYILYGKSIKKRINSPLNNILRLHHRLKTTIYNSEHHSHAYNHVYITQWSSSCVCICMISVFHEIAYICTVLQGGVIDSNASITISNTNFTSNSARYGGVMDTTGDRLINHHQ